MTIQNSFLLLKTFFGGLVFLLSLQTIAGQSASHTDNKADQTLRSSGRVNPSTLGMEIDIPLGNYPGRGISMPINLSYSSKLWRLDYINTQPKPTDPSQCVTRNKPMYAERSASGWTSSMKQAYIEYTGDVNTFQDDGTAYGVTLCSEPANTNTYFIKRLTINLPSGESHELRADDTPDGTTSSNLTGWFYAVDGSNVRYYQNISTGTYRLFLTDGSYYDFASTTGTIDQTPVRKAILYTDRNGNQIIYNPPTTGFPNGYWTDTMGRNLSIPVPDSSSGVSTTQPQIYTLPGMTGSYKFYWKNLKGTTAGESGLTDFNLSLKYRADNPQHGVPPDPARQSLFTSDLYANWVVGGDIFNPVVLTKIELPNGQSYSFTYNIYGEIERIYYPTGGEEKFEHNQITGLSEDVFPQSQVSRGVTKRQVFTTADTGTPVEWNYNAAVVGTDYTITTTAPDSTYTQRLLTRGYGSDNTSFGYDNGLAGMPYEERAYSALGQLLTKSIKQWQITSMAVGTQGNFAHWFPRVTQEENIIYDTSGNGLSTTTSFEYEGYLLNRDAPLLARKQTQHAFKVAGSGGSLIPVKSVESTFLINDSSIAQTVRDIYKDQNMVGLTTASVVKNGAGTIVARSETRYDESGYSPGYRGNPTTSRVWDSTKGTETNANAYISTRAKFDSWGNPTESTDAKGNITTIAYDTTYNAFPVSVTTGIPDPNPSQNPDGLAHGSQSAFVTTATFDYTTGLPLTTTDANGLETRIEYDPLTLRPLNTKTFYQNNQVGSQSETVYHDEPNNYWVKSRALIDTNKWAESIAYFDGLGRAYKSEEINSQGNAFVEKEFDAEGRVKRVTNPFRTGETKYWTTNVYDEASRVKEVVLPGGAKVLTDYGVSTSGTIGVTKQITDQAGKKRKGITDALGRMIRVIEDPTGQNLNTDYVFDTLGNLRKTTQGVQDRYFTYDSLGRLLYAKQPEQDANAAFAATDSITGNTQWSVKYEYDDNGNITKTTDARGVYVQGTYDKFNRLIFRDYSGATPDAHFYYDGTGLGAVPNFSKGKTTKVSSSVSESRYTSFDNLGRLLTSEQVTDGQTYPSIYTYNLSGALIEQTYPSGRVVKNVLNNDGELAIVQSKQNGNTGFYNYADSISYNSSGAVEKMQLGNGRWETALYDERQQVKQIGLGKVDNAQDLLKLEYNYGTATENNGSLREQKITVPAVGINPGFTATQTYAYDNLNRLESATETSNNQQTWKQTFTYDRYGNRGFDANNTTTLGSCSQAVCNPLINTSDNHFSSGQGYSYDPNGNVTTDAAGQQFLYDAENHQKEVKDVYNNTIGLYLYDGEGKRVKKISNTETTIFVYDGGGQLVAEYSTQISTTPQVSYLTTDALGSPRVITDANGNVTSRKDYSAFGDETVTSQRISELGYQPKTVRQDYTGYQKDEESQLEFAQARYYNNQHGRFTSVDPLTASATIKDPQSFNRYSYVLNSPYKFTDPLGLIGVYAGACGSWCQGSGPYLDGSNFRGTDDPLDWAREYYGNVVGYGIDQPDGSTVVNGTVIPPPVDGTVGYGRVVSSIRSTNEWKWYLVNPVTGTETYLHTGGMDYDITVAVIEYSPVNVGERAKGMPKFGLFDTILEGKDHKGHIIGAALGGQGDGDNLFSQLPSVNQVKFNQFEREIRKVLTANQTWKANIVVQLNYNPAPQTYPGYLTSSQKYLYRPISVDYSVVFINSAGKTVGNLSNHFSN